MANMIKRLEETARQTMQGEQCLRDESCRYPGCSCARIIARAVLKELREPDEGMIGAMDINNISPHPQRPIALIRWQAAIDKALEND